VFVPIVAVDEEKQQQTHAEQVAVSIRSEAVENGAERRRGAVAAHEGEELTKH